MNLTKLVLKNRIDYGIMGYCAIYKIYPGEIPISLVSQLGGITKLISCSHQVSSNVPTVRSISKVSFSYSSIVVWNNLTLIIRLNQYQDMNINKYK